MMVTIQQDKQHFTNLPHMFSKQLTTTVEIYIEQVQEDIERMNKELLNAKSKADKENIKNIIKWLERIIAKTDNGELEYSWSYFENNGLKTYPIEVRNIEEYGIYFVDYLKAKENQKIVRLEYTDLANLIAFEMMHRDLGYSNYNMEERLKKIGIVGVYDIRDFLDNIEKDERDTYKLSKMLGIENSPYLRADRKKITDYFNIKEFNAKLYREAVEYSCRHAMMLVLEKTMNNLYNSKLKFSLCAITNTEIDIIFEDVNSLNIDEKLVESVIVRIFGRRFEVKPKIQVY